MGTVPKLNAAEASALLTTKGAVYLDVRTPQEFGAGHVPGAVNVPVALEAAGGRQTNEGFVEQVKAALPDPTAELCVACGGGSRSATAARQLAAAGYTNIKHVADGYTGWCAAGLPVERQQRSKA